MSDHCRIFVGRNIAREGFGSEEEIVSAFERASSKSAVATFAPYNISIRAISAPIPPAAPVTMVVFPERFE